jgi:hypothetical protein
MITRSRRSAVTFEIIRRRRRTRIRTKMRRRSNPRISQDCHVSMNAADRAGRIIITTMMRPVIRLASSGRVVCIARRVTNRRCARCARVADGIVTSAVVAIIRCVSVRSCAADGDLHRSAQPSRLVSFPPGRMITWMAQRLPIAQFSCNLYQPG